MENQNQPVPPAAAAPVVPPPFVNQSAAPVAPSARLLLVAAASLIVLGSGFWLWAPRAAKPETAPVVSTTTAPAAATATATAAVAETATTTPEEKPVTPRATSTVPASPVTDFPGLDADDWLRGGSNPEVALVVYTDLDCPFCQRLHARLDKIVAPYGGDVAWTLRHMPLSMHPDAFAKAVAAECVAGRLGSAAFWGFVDAAFSGGKMSSGLGASFGLSRDDLVACAEGAAGEAVLREMAAAKAAGATGTPYTVIVNRAGDRVVVSGAQDDAAFAAAIVKLKDGVAVSARE
jgi:protein-disulfide isomerase